MSKESSPESQNGLAKNTTKTNTVTTIQKFAIAEELRTAINLLKYGLRELQMIDGANDFYHLPFILLASGLERLMKVIKCCYHLQNEEILPTCNDLRKNGHNLIELLDYTKSNCFSDAYLETPVAKEDKEFLESNPRLAEIIEILSDFGTGGRYYNLDTAIGKEVPKQSPKEKWQRLELDILKEDPDWKKKLGSEHKLDNTLKDVNTKITVHLEKLIRALCRLLTIGKLGDYAKQISGHAFFFILLKDGQLGKTNYEIIKIL